MSTETTTKSGDAFLKGHGTFPRPSLVPNPTFSPSAVLIPKNAGKGKIKARYQRRAMMVYAFLWSFGLYGFNRFFESSKLRVLSLGLLFPGAGFVAVGSFSSLLFLSFSIAAIPLVLFLWFGCGGVVFPLFLWSGSALAAMLLAKDVLFEGAGVLCACICILAVTYILWKIRVENANAEAKRQERNQYLAEEYQENQRAAPTPSLSRELDLKTLRFVQWILEVGLAGHDDWTYHDIIDQFQTAALRYQLYEVIYSLALYQRYYTPNFHGYLSAAQRNAIKKSTCQKVMSFWKWECLTGKFNVTNWDPIKKDNIMVTGFLLQAIGLYQSNTQDRRYCENGSLEFVITENARFRSNFRQLADAVYDNMNTNPYCLYPCEPNWIYTPCNLVGISGIVLADRILGLSYGKTLHGRFEKALEEEFTNPDGSILPIRSALTGFTIPGLCGVMSDCFNSILCAAFLPHIAHRNWAMTKRESITYNQDGQIDIRNLKGADTMDPGNYQSGKGTIYAITAEAAGEFGDYTAHDQCLAELDKLHPVFTTPTGALKNKGISTLVQGTALRARLIQYQDWTTMTTSSPPANVLEGPLLDEAPFPEVLVAKAYSPDGKSLELVLYNGKLAGTVQLGFSRLVPRREYVYGNGKAIVAGEDGKVTLEIFVDGRTAVTLSPVARSG